MYTGTSVLLVQRNCSHEPLPPHPRGQHGVLERGETKMSVGPFMYTPAVDRTDWDDGHHDVNWCAQVLIGGEIFAECFGPNSAVPYENAKRIAQTLNNNSGHNLAEPLVDYRREMWVSE